MAKEKRGKFVACANKKVAMKIAHKFNKMFKSVKAYALKTNGANFIFVGGGFTEKMCSLSTSLLATEQNRVRLVTGLIDDFSSNQLSELSKYLIGKAMDELIKNQNGEKKNG